MANTNPHIFKDYANNKTSILVQDQLPEFVRNNYPTFIAFMEAYYEFLEQTIEINTLSKNLPNMLDIDYVDQNSITDFIELFRQQYLNRIPKNVLANKSLLTKHIKSFYTSRGTRKSFKLLFRILFNEDVDVFNTGDQILIASGGNWYQPNVLRIQTTNNLTNFVNTQIYGITSKATAIVDTVNLNYNNGVAYNELSISNILGKFTPNETIKSTSISGNTLYGVLTGSISNINVTYGGALYNIGDPVLISGSGGANAFVSQVSSGGLSSLNIINGGAGYQQYPNVAIGISASVLAPVAHITNIDLSGTVSQNNIIISNSVIAPSLNIAANTYGNNIINQTMSYISYPCGPLQIIQIISPGQGVGPTAVATVSQAYPIGNTNNYIQDYGSIGRFTVINGGTNYKVGDDIKFINTTARGIGAGARVNTVDANGTILTVLANLPTITGQVSYSNGSNTVIGNGTLFTRELIANNDITYPGSGSYITINNNSLLVTTITNNTILTVNTNFTQNLANQVVGISGLPVGGIGYQQSDFASGVTLNVLSVNGMGAVVTPYCILGQGAVLTPVANSQYGTIEQIKLTNFGSTYANTPTISLKNFGDGTATATATFINGIFQYPGYYLDEGGMLSSRRYIQNANQYNNYSYILQSPVAMSLYKQVVEDLLSPAGTNMVGVVTLNSKNNLSLVDGLGGRSNTQIGISPPLYDFNFLTTTLDSNLTFTRASTGTYCSNTGIITVANNNTPRFDYGFIPSGVTNLEPFSMPMTNYFSQPRYTSVITTDVAPPLFAPAAAVRKITDVVGNGDNNAGDDVSNSIFTNTLYTASIWVWIPLSFTGVAVGLSGFGDISNSYINADMSFGKRNQWQRISVTSSWSSIVTSGWVFRPSTNLGDYLYWCMPQFEMGSVANTYVPTYNSIANIGAKPLGLLMEMQSENLLLQSSSIGITTPWYTRSSPTLASGYLAPDYTYTGVKVTPGTTSGFYDVAQNFATTTGQPYVFSCFVRPAGYTYLHFQIWDFAATNFGGVECWINMSGVGTVGRVNNGGTATGAYATITQASNGWYLVTLSGIPSVGATGSFVEANVRGSTGYGDNGITGDGTSGWLVWGAQVEYGLTRTSYIPTTTYNVTRSGETNSVTNYIGNSTNQSVAIEGLWSRVPSDGGHLVWQINDGTSNNLVQLYNQLGQMNVYVTENANGTSYINGSLGSKSVANNIPFIHIATWNNGAFTDASNGIVSFTDTVPRPVGLNILYIGGLPGGVTMNGYIRRLRYWNTCIPTSMLALTTKQYL